MAAGIFAVQKRLEVAIFNDAGVGKDNAGVSRLPWLEKHGIEGTAVSAASARIGMGLETYQNGEVSFVNGLGRTLGIKKGMTAMLLGEAGVHMVLTYMDSNGGALMV